MANDETTKPEDENEDWAASPDDAPEGEDKEPTAEPEEEVTGSLDFDLDLQSIPVNLKDTRGRIRKLRLWELDGVERDVWMNKNSSRIQLLPDGTQRIKDHRGSQSSLLAVSLRERHEDDDGTISSLKGENYNGPKGDLVKEDVIQKFPSKVQSKLFLASADMSGLTDDAKKKAKND